MAAKAPKADTHVFMDRSFTLPIDNVRARTLPAGWRGRVTKAEAKEIVDAGAGRVEPDAAEIEAAAAAKAAEEAAKTSGA